MSRPYTEKVSYEDEVKVPINYFNKVGSSFTGVKPWGFDIIPEEDHLKFSSAHLQSLVSLVSIIVRTF